MLTAVTRVAEGPAAASAFGQKGVSDTLLRRGLLLIAMPLVFQVLVLAILFWNEAASREAELLALHSQRVISQSESAMRRQFEEVSRMRGLILTQNPSFAGRRPSVVPELREVCRLVGDDPPQLQRAEGLLAAVRKLEARGDFLEQLVRAGRFAEATESIRTLRGERMLQDTMAKLDDFLAAEERLGVERVERLQQSRRVQRWALVGAVLATMAITLLQARAFARGFSSRLAVVNANARRIAENSPLEPLLGGDDEIAELDRTLHAAADRLVAAAAAERRYEAELEERAEELVLTNQDLVHKSREIEIYVYSVSHDLRSPLVNLQGFSREIELSCNDLWRVLEPLELAPEVRRELAAIERDMRESVHFILVSVSSSGRLIDALLRLSRAGRMRYQWQTIDAVEVVHRMLEVLRVRIEEKGARVTVGDLPPARGDLTAVEQIFGNLLSNAVNYLDPRRPGEIEVGAEAGPPGSPVTYWVRDNGLGIPQAFRDKLFVAFQRFHADVAPGEGIGLALVRRAVERHGGDVGVESEEGVGSLFLFTLPGGEQEGPDGESTPSSL
jgi:signal transduction histidine kinase